MEFPDLNQQKDKLIDLFSYEQEVAPEKIHIIASPYRICPLGAHIDHQGGPVLGMTINACTLMAFQPDSSNKVRLKSRNYPGKVSFSLADIPVSTGSFWGVYPRAAALALQESYRLEFGITRLDDVKPNTPVTGRRFPAQRMVLTPVAAVELINRMQQVGQALAQAGVLKANPAGGTKPTN